jgi:hypothetical protein
MISAFHLLRRPKQAGIINDNIILIIIIIINSTEQNPSWEADSRQRRQSIYCLLRNLKHHYIVRSGQ